MVPYNCRADVPLGHPRADRSECRSPAPTSCTGHGLPSALCARTPAKPGSKHHVYHTPPRFQATRVPHTTQIPSITSSHATQVRKLPHSIKGAPPAHKGPPPARGCRWGGEQQAPPGACLFGAHTRYPTSPPFSHQASSCAPAGLCPDYNNSLSVSQGAYVPVSQC